MKLLDGGIGGGQRVVRKAEKNDQCQLTKGESERGEKLRGIEIRCEGELKKSKQGT